MLFPSGSGPKRDLLFTHTFFPDDTPQRNSIVKSATETGFDGTHFPGRAAFRRRVQGPGGTCRRGAGGEKPPTNPPEETTEGEEAAIRMPCLLKKLYYNSL